MDTVSVLVGLVVGLAAGLVLGIWVAGLRNTPTLGRSAGLDPLPRPEPTEEPATEASELAGTGTSAASQPHRAGLRVSKTIVRHELKTVIAPEGIRVESDGRTYASLDEIPDPALRERVRSLLAQAPADVHDPALRARVEDELRNAGIETAPDGGGTDQAGGGSASADGASGEAAAQADAALQDAARPEDRAPSHDAPPGPDA